MNKFDKINNESKQNEQNYKTNKTKGTEQIKMSTHNSKQTNK